VSIDMSNRSRTIRRRGFSLLELLVALAVSAMLLTAALVALDASFRAYRRTTEEASTHTISRLAMHRILALVRTGVDFGPIPPSPLEEEIESDYLEVLTPDGRWVVIRWDGEGERLLVAVDSNDGEPGIARELLGGVEPQFHPDGAPIRPFRLAFEDGWRVRRVTVDLSIKPDDDRSSAISSEETPSIRLVGSASPRALGS
jgi:prepilin-type N-terminal cleavage/methylation domain-containing protein